MMKRKISRPAEERFPDVLALGLMAVGGVSDAPQ